MSRERADLSYRRSPAHGQRDGTRWRRGRDSNPREAYAPTRFPVVPVRPLRHLSAVMRPGNKSRRESVVAAALSSSGGESVVRTSALLPVVLGLDGPLSHGSSHGIGSVGLPSERGRAHYPLGTMGPIYTLRDALSLAAVLRGSHDCNVSAGLRGAPRQRGSSAGP